MRKISQFKYLEPDQCESTIMWGNRIARKINELVDGFNWIRQCYINHIEQCEHKMWTPKQTQEPERKEEKPCHWCGAVGDEEHGCGVPAKEPECEHPFSNPLSGCDCINSIKTCLTHGEKPVKNECEHKWRHVDFQGCLCDKCFITLSEYQKQRFNESK